MSPSTHRSPQDSTPRSGLVEEASQHGADQGLRPAHLRAAGVIVDYRKPGSAEEPGSGTVVDRVDLTLHKGDFVCIVGPSGCGKTTFLNAVAGFLPITGGSLTVDGSAVPGPGPDRAMVFQHASLLPWRSVLDNVTYGLELGKRVKRAEARERARDLLDLVGLSAAADRHPGQLSGGMQQRVNLARALAVEPEVLLLDEPFASIDAQTREVMQVELARICAEKSVTALFVTHDITEAAFLSDRVCVFSPRPGRIVREIDVPLPRPRGQEIRKLPAFQALVEDISDTLHGAASGRPDAAAANGGAA
ncbi:ABC transporter ATP-binding protein [Streptomyces tremellae]|uniref:ABC transporter domain-containing protein n=1 Tax=Streptomyces tremellae TaxID=1124239 RepID=A0ABP7E308_9ACTN